MYVVDFDCTYSFVLKIDRVTDNRSLQKLFTVKQVTHVQLYKEENKCSDIVIVVVKLHVTLWEAGDIIDILLWGEW